MAVLRLIYNAEAKVNTARGLTCVYHVDAIFLLKQLVQFVAFSGHRCVSFLCSRLVSLRKRKDFVMVMIIGI